MSAEIKKEIQLEIAHILLIDVVGYSKLLVNEQIELLQELNQIVRSAECFHAAEARGELIRVPTGDGMALVCFHSPEEPVRRKSGFPTPDKDATAVTLSNDVISLVADVFARDASLTLQRLIK